MKHLTVLLLILCLLPADLPAQETFHVNGVHDDRPDVHALINARIVTAPGTVIDKGVVLVNGDRISAVGANVAIPDGAVVHDLDGLYLYPGFVELDGDYGMPEVKEAKFSEEQGPQMESQTPGAYNWNQAIRAEVNAADMFTVDKAAAEEWRKRGVSAVVTHRHDGIARGVSILVSTADKDVHEVVLKDEVAAHYSFDKGSSTQDYPGSLMGAIALLRQTFLDAEWYADGGSRAEYNITLDELNKTSGLPQFFEVSNKLDVLRAAKIGAEFNKQFVVRCGNDSYQRIPEIKQSNVALVVPLDFPKPFKVTDPFDAYDISLARLQHWDLAPAGPAMLNQAGIRFALTTAEHKAAEDFWNQLRKAIQFGLSPEEALAALTVVPASLAGAQNDLGTIADGKIANILVTTGPLESKDAELVQHWVQGKQHNLGDVSLLRLRGSYNLNVASLGEFKLKLTGDASGLQADIDGEEARLDIAGRSISLSFRPQKKGTALLLSGTIDGDRAMSGRAQRVGGPWINWTATFKSAHKDSKHAAVKERQPISSVNYPLGAYGWDELPSSGSYLIRNATVWTCEADGILTNADVLVQNGKIAQVGQNLSAGGATVIDGTGKHVSPGVIDEHSHIAISRGVNEWTQASSAEVRIGDVVNSDDVNIYRQLAGGVTTSQLLHGSANPIGGQSALIKLRWGQAPEAMKFEGADGFIKFALGENVKQSNWGDLNTVRFPQTRMGVEQVYVDHFTRAVEYEKAWNDYNALGPAQQRAQIPPRRDLDLETLLEIVRNERFITCHSYVQSEISMLMDVADRFGFRINTFTHILEGYKVADIMKEHGAGASSFSDWWAYKYEVIDAIPHNGAILHRMDIVTAFNSDSPEMARRLNQEAAKAVKYGAISEEEALKFVTINPATLLHIDDRVGSIKVGKDADLVLWTDNPLSIYAKVEKTFVDGTLMYDRARDAELLAAAEKQRHELIEQMRVAQANGEDTEEAGEEEEEHFHCEDIHDFGREEVRHNHHSSGHHE